MATTDTSHVPAPVLEKLTIPHRGDQISGIRIYADGAVQMFHGTYAEHSDDARWQGGLILSQQGMDKLIPFLNTELSTLDGKMENNQGVVIYKVITSEKQYQLSYKNIAYDKLPPQLLELEKLINGHVQQVQSN